MVTRTELITNLTKTIIKLLTLKTPSSKNYGKIFTGIARFAKSNHLLLPEFSIEYIQTISSFCKNLPFPGLHFEKTTIPDEFREQAYQFTKTYFQQRYGFYPVPSDHYWKLGKPLVLQWIKPIFQQDSNPQSVIYYIFGGAYTFGHSCLFNPIYADLSKVSSSKLLTVEYRLGPQYTIPSQIEDVLATYFYLLAPVSGGGMGMNSSQVVVGGASSGGGLAANMIHILRTAKLSQPAGAFLWSPSIDLTFSQPSMVENNGVDLLWYLIDRPIVLGDNGLTLDSGHALWMYNRSSQSVKDRMIKDGATLGPKKGLVWPDFSPLLDPDMDNLPPTLIIVGEKDSLRDTGIVYGKLRAESNIRNQEKKTIIPNVQTIVYEDMIHAFMVVFGNQRGKEAIRSTSEFIYHALNPNSEQKLSAKQYRYLPDYKKAYMNTTYNMYWNNLQSQTTPWESPYKITPFPVTSNFTTPVILGNGLPSI